MTEWPFVDGEMARRVRDHDWSSTPLGPTAVWPAALRRAAAIALSAPMASVLLWGPEYIVVAYNEGYRAILGAEPEVLGHPVLEVWAEERALLEPQLARVLNGETLLFPEPPMSLPNAAVSDVGRFDYGYGPVRDDSGAIAGVIVSILDVTDRVLAQRALRESEEKYRSLFQWIDEGFAVIEFLPDSKDRSVDFRFLEVNESFERQTGNRDVAGKLGSEVNAGIDAVWIETFSEVARTGEAARLEIHHQATGRWYNVYATRVEAAASRQVCVVFADITERKEREERQAYLLKLSDTLRPLADPDDIMAAASEALGRHLGVGRCAYCEVDEACEYYTVFRDWTDGSMPSMVGRHHFGYGDQFREQYRAGRSVLIDDALAGARAAGNEAGFEAAGGFRAAIGLPLIKEGRFVAGFFVMQLAPRHWRAEDEALMMDVAERTWAAVERARAEAALRVSEERQAFLLKLSDTLRLLADPNEIMAAAREALGRYLNVGRCAFCEMDETGDYFIVEHDWTEGIMPSYVGRHFFGFGDQFREDYRAGKSVLIYDALADARADGNEAAFEAAGGVRASIGIPLVKEGHFVAGFFVQQLKPRHWTKQDEALTREVAERTWAAAERARVEAALRESEDRQAFLLKLSDALRPLVDPIEVLQTAMRLVKDHFDVDSAVYHEFDAKGDRVITREGITNDRIRMPEVWRLQDFGFEEELKAGRAIWYEDTETDPRLRDSLSSYRATRIRAGLGVTLLKGGRLVAMVGLTDSEPRAWPEDQRRLVETVAERTWEAVERARAEAALRESETKYRSLFDTMSEGFVTCEAIRDEAGNLTDWRFLDVNSAFEAQTGLKRSSASGKTVSELLPNIEQWWRDGYQRVLDSGQPERFENYVKDLDRWYQVSVYQRGPNQFAAIYGDISVRKRADREQRESEERQAFLLTLSDALRAEPGVEAIGNRATQMIAEQLRADRVYLVTVDTGADRVVVTQETRRADMPPLRGVYRGTEFPSAFREIFKRTIVYSDVRCDPRLGDAERAAFAGLSAVSFIAAPIKRGTEDMIWAAGALSTEPRTWTPNEIAMFEDAVERTWAAVERARAETELRESEERFTQFAKASLAGIWIRDAATLAMEYVSPAIGAIYGIERDAILGEVEKWATMIVPEDRDTALKHIESARQGEPVTHEFRIQRPADGTFRWIRNTDFPLDQNGHVGRIGGIAEDVTETKLSVEHQAVLLAELQHRVRNIMAIIRSIVARTARGADDVEHYSELLSGRLITLARVQALLTRAANAGVSLVTIVHDELSAQAAHADQFDAIGPEVMLSAKAAETMTLAVHELTTNALKYGALSAPNGRVTVRWTVEEKRGAPWLVFDWNETGAPARPVAAVPRRVGFGSELIEGRIPYELGGRGKVTIEAEGAQCHLEFPLKDGASVLETDAPKRVDVFGGAIDMTGAADLGGQRVLVVEDDYYLANDTARALKGAGAEVVGPCPSEDAARDAMADAPPTGAILDINLNGGRSFQLAHELSEQGIPFIFVTGYDQEVIPTEFQNVPRLQKPADFRLVIAALADALS